MIGSAMSLLRFGFETKVIFSENFPRNANQLRIDLCGESRNKVIANSDEFFGEPIMVKFTEYGWRSAGPFALVTGSFVAIIGAALHSANEVGADPVPTPRRAAPSDSMREIQPLIVPESSMRIGVEESLTDEKLSTQSSAAVPSPVFHGNLRGLQPQASSILVPSTRIQME
jgi:hypothetical protein